MVNEDEGQWGSPGGVALEQGNREPDVGVAGEGRVEGGMDVPGKELVREPVEEPGVGGGRQRCSNCGFVFDSDQAVAGCAGAAGDLECGGSGFSGCAGCYQAQPKCPSCGMGLGKQGVFTKLLSKLWKP